MAVAATIAVESRTAEYPTASIADLLRWCASITPSRLQDELRNRSVQFAVRLVGIPVSLEKGTNRQVRGSFLSESEDSPDATRFTGFCEVPAELALAIVVGGETADVASLVEIWRVEPEVGSQPPEPIVVQAEVYPDDASRRRDKFSRIRQLGPEGAREAGDVDQELEATAAPVTTSYTVCRITAADVLVRREVATAVVQALTGSALSDVKAWRDGALQLELLRRMQSPGEDGYAPGLHTAWQLWQSHVLAKAPEDRSRLTKDDLQRAARDLAVKARPCESNGSAQVSTGGLDEAVAKVVADRFMLLPGAKRRNAAPRPVAPAAAGQVRPKKRPNHQ
jgi:hypothetical protein